MPYLFPWPNGTANGLKPYNDELAFNFIVAGGGANGGSFDHDDGSSFYDDHHNFEVYGGKRCLLLFSATLGIFSFFLSAHLPSLSSPLSRQEIGL